MFFGGFVGIELSLPVRLLAFILTPTASTTTPVGGRVISPASSGCGLTQPRRSSCPPRVGGTPVAIPRSLASRPALPGASSSACEAMQPDPRCGGDVQRLPSARHADRDCPVGGRARRGAQALALGAEEQSHALGDRLVRAELADVGPAGRGEPGDREPVSPP